MNSTESFDPGVVIGHLGRPHGTRGWIHARATGATLATLEVGESVIVAFPDGRQTSAVIAGQAGEGERIRLALEGLTNRDDAAAYTGATLSVPFDRLPPVGDDDTFYVRDVIGCVVYLAEREVGTVRDVQSGPANDVLDVGGDDGISVLIPFTADAIVALDVVDRVIRVRPDLLG